MRFLRCHDESRNVVAFDRSLTDFHHGSNPTIVGRFDSSGLYSQ